MPLYVYKCKKCDKQHEIFLKLENYREEQFCPVCGQKLEKIPTIGGIEPDQPSWLDHNVIGALQNTDRIAKKLEKPIETRGEWKRYLKENGIEPL